MDDLVVEFIAETNESLGLIDNDLIALEQNPNDKAIIGNLFRLVHTIKGTCGFLGLGRLEKLAHHAENVMGRFRDGDLAVKEEYVSLILESVDQIKYLVGELEANGAEPAGDDSGLIEKLDAVYEGRDALQSSSSSADTVMEVTPSASAKTVDMNSLSKTPNPNNEGGLSDYDLAVLQAAFDAAPSDESAGFIPQHYTTTEMAKAEMPAPAVAAAPSAPIKEKPAVKPVSKAADHEESSAGGADNQQGQGGGAGVQSLRVNVDVLENLMTMVSELVLTRNQLMQIMRTAKDGSFSTPLQRLNHIVSDLQEGVMKTRMQPVGNAWAKLPRIIRDISIELGKKIDLQMNGQETELDRQILDLIKDPLTHMVRNSADHGIENPHDRLAAGKPETGTIVLNAYHEGGHIIMEIKDDGKGLNTTRIREKALEKGLATEDELNAMSPKQINQFIFAAGFSTAAQVTSVSGRGVGMDVVRTNIEKISGTIDLDSREGEGTTVSIKIPLTLAIVSALIVESAKERFAIPQLSVQELVMTSAQGENKIEMIKGTPVYRLRNRLLPLVYLDNLLKLKKPAVVSIETDAQDSGGKLPEAKAVNDNRYIVVTRVGAYNFGIVVDRVYDTEEIVVKPVAKILKNIDLFSGNTILGDGTVIMILDPGGIARASGEITVSDTSAADKDTDHQVARGQQKTSLLLFKAHDGAPKAVPLQLVARLEDINMAQVEHSNGKMLIQYRGSLMPLIRFDEAMELDKTGVQPTLVFSDGRRSMGLMVTEIIDIMEDYINVQINSDRTSCLGSAIINGKATDVINVGHYLNRAYNNWFEDHGHEDFSENTKEMDVQKRILIVDDSPFFRNMLAPILGVAGYNVETAETAGEALDFLDRGEEFDVIVSDIEMPEMNGFEFAKTIKSSKWKNIPMVALTSHATDRDIEKGRDVGFTEYVAKFDRETLLNALSDTIRRARHIEDQQKAGAA